MRRLATVRFWRHRWLPVIAAVVVGGLFAYGIVTAATTESRICERVDALANADLGGYRRALKTIPTLYYYQANPNERIAAIRAIKRQIRDIRGATC